MAEQRIKGKTKELLDVAQTAARPKRHRLILSAKGRSGNPQTLARFVETMWLLDLNSEDARASARDRLDQAYQIAAEQVKELKYSEKSFADAKNSSIALLKLISRTAKNFIERNSREYSNTLVEDRSFKAAIDKVREAFLQRTMAEAGLGFKKGKPVAAEDAISELAAVFGLSVTIREKSETLDPILRDILKSDLERWDSEPLRAGKRSENASQFIRRVYAKWLADDGEHQLAQGHLRTSDPKLYHAYTSHIRPARHPEDDLKLPKLPHVRRGDDDPATELKRRKKLDAERSRRGRVKSKDLT